MASIALAEAKRADRVLSVQAPADVAELAGIDPERMARVARARRPLRDAVLKGRWCTSLWPTPALAAQAGMSDEDHGAFVERALSSTGPTRCGRGTGCMPSRTS